MGFPLLGFALGLVMLVAGGELFVMGALRLGGMLRVSSWVTGATFVAFATSAPELSVNLVAAVHGRTDLAFGNLVGSNIANIGLILAVAVLLRPVPMGDHGRERGFLALLLVATLGLVLDSALRGGAAKIGWSEACALLLGFFFYLARLVRQDGVAESQGPSRGWLRAALAVAAGLMLLGLGGDVAVRGASGLAQALRVPPVLVGLTAVAVGTSLPELFASLAALRRGEAELLLGTILGSNLFNLLFIMSATALVRPVAVPPRGLLDLLVMAAFSAFLLRVGLRGRSLVRPQGVLLLLAYLVYVGARWAVGVEPVS